MSDWTSTTGSAEALWRIRECGSTLSETLDLSRLALNSLPPEIGQLHWLTLLDLQGNQLSTLPPEIGQLSKLRKLNLSSNRLSAMPPEFGQLTELTELNLTGNRLAALPPEIGRLSVLEELYVRSNQLTTLPSEIGHLSALTLLGLQDNKLTSLPPMIQKLRKLTQLFLHGNYEGLGLTDESLGPKSTEVIQKLKQAKPPEEILAIYFTQLAGGSKALNEVKVILVGRGGAGKTSIRKRLIKDSFNPYQRETAGIKIDYWMLDEKKDGKKDGVTEDGKKDGIKAHVWDFAGQEITHATHQFFLTRRSLYLLVLEGRSDLQDRDAEYWLRLIRAFGADSPVIVVLNKWVDKPFAVAEFTLRHEFSNIQVFIRTDCRTGLGIHELKKVIRETAVEMETVKQDFPRLWFSVKNYMAGMKENYLPLSRYREICNDYGVVSELDQNALIGYLHDLGIILHYAGDARLAGTTVLNPRWVTASVYVLLRHAERRQAHDGEFTGHLTLAEARLALENTDVEMVMYLVGLMERFELCYALEGHENTWLVPQLLAPQTPQNLGDKWFKANSTRLRYRYNVLPEGLLPRFIVRAHPLISENHVWRQGVVLEMDHEDTGETAYALVIAEPGKERIQVTVIGAKDARLRLTKLVRAHFQNIHEDFDQRSTTSDKSVNSLDARELLELEDKPGLFKSVKALIVDEKKGQQSGISTDEEGSIRIDQKQELDRVAAPEGKERRNTAMEIFEDRQKVFLSYAHADSGHRDVLMQNLKVMEMDGIIDWWYDGKVLPSQNLEIEIRQALEEADVILFLLSTASLSSRYIQEFELYRAFERLLSESLQTTRPIIVPILLEADCAWKSWGERTIGKIGDFEFLPINQKGEVLAVDQWPSRRKAFNSVEQSLRRMLEIIKNKA